MYINKIELYVNGELLDTSHDRKILSQIPLRDKTVIVAKVGVIYVYFIRTIYFISPRRAGKYNFVFIIRFQVLPRTGNENIVKIYSFC